LQLIFAAYGANGDNLADRLGHGFTHESGCKPTPTDVRRRG